jgi:hypothetical protein
MIIKGGFLTMGSKRIGLARIEAMLENLKRDINWGSTTHSGYRRQFKYITTAAGSHDYTGLDGDLLIMVNAAKADGTYILLPEATTANGGMHVRVALGIAIADDFAVGFVTSKIIGGAFAVGDTNEANSPTDVATAIADVGDSFNSVRFNLDTVAAAGGTGGTVLDFYYPGVADVILYSGRLISEIDDPTLTGHFSTTAANA